ncbi:TetR/AcrR family transcriptional regulator [Corynebacterium sp. MSK041]|uniref:TetR/AcrR family transcriptional regulator n=1 Tax=Corynebacterium sp. MSK041 TaxID=3050194 RepID=UPI00254EDAE8|nr:TetR/AcrR family transcriptional regulator [Corynebacterium sp. MSK041]MDK8795882.1 TetR/AcrR family transcriptional regulator [Corynebacterium sp. MSK041]
MTELGVGGSHPDGIEPTGPVSPTDAAEGANKADLDRAITVAMSHFAQEGYAATRLDAIAKEVGMSKRMLHYHFGDKKELYRRCLVHAAWSFSPPQDFLERSYAAPVEGIRRFVDALHHGMVQNPEAIRLLLRENLDPVLTPGEATSLRGESEVILQLERLLLMGQDVGAFRPGISAADVVVLIASLSFFRTSNHITMDEFSSINLLSPANTEGMRRLTIDAVLTFLTSNIPDSGYESYLTHTTGTPRAIHSDDDGHTKDYLSGTSIAEPLIDDIYDDDLEPSGE